MDNKKNSSMEVVWMIRDARGLTMNEKSFLWLIASRGMVKTSRTTLMEDLNCSTGTITNLVRSLKEEKDLINVFPGYWKDGKKTATHYSIKEDVLATYLPAPVCVQDMNTPVHEVNTPVQDMNESVHDMAGKGTIKVTDKETTKATYKTDASAPVVISKSSLSKENQEAFSYKAKAPSEFPLDTDTRFDTNTHAPREPTFGTMQTLDDGSVFVDLGASATGPRYMLCEHGVTGPAEASDQPDDSPEPLSGYDREIAEHDAKWRDHRRKHGRMGWDDTKREHEERQVIEERHGMVDLNAW